MDRQEKIRQLKGFIDGSISIREAIIPDNLEPDYQKLTTGQLHQLLGISKRLNLERFSADCPGLDPSEMEFLKSLPQKGIDDTVPNFDHLAIEDIDDLLNQFDK